MENLKTFKFVGSLTGTEKKYYSWDKEKKYPHYEFVGERRELGVFKFRSLDEAELFFIANFPEYYFGGNIIQVNTPSGKGDFAMFAVAEYYEYEFGTSDREKILDKILAGILAR